MSYNIINLIDTFGTASEGHIKNDLLSYLCPYNKDVECFLRDKALMFAQMGISQTFLVYTSFRDNQVLVGYFTLSVKGIKVDKDGFSKNWQRRLAKFGTLDTHENKYFIGAPLIGQLGKNFQNGYNDLIKGDQLLQMACDKIKLAQRILGGRFVYLECEDVIGLRRFYEENGFVCFGQRQLDSDEHNIKGTYLLQLIKHFKSD